MSVQDEIGSRGELIAQLKLLTPCRKWRGNELSYFAPVLLGGKHPTIDLLVQLEAVGKRLLFFVAQVKATRDVPRNSNSRLPIAVPADDIQRMLRSHIPAYLIGVDETNGVAYLLAVTVSMRDGLRSFPRTHKLDERNLRLLWDEVRGYWERTTRPRRRSRFVE